MDVINQLLKDISIPRMIKVRQSFVSKQIPDIHAVLVPQLKHHSELNGITKNSRIAIAVGSRGITNLVQLVSVIVNEVKIRGAHPFIVPAMGSHGGATAEGQKALLASLGITEKTCGAAIISSMETVTLTTLDSGLPVCIDKHAYQADGIIILNRVKPHSSFRGTYESGLVKMLVIGLGKQKGAASCHSQGFGRMEENLQTIGQELISRTNILAAIGILENHEHQTSNIVVLSKNEILDREPKLLQEAWNLMPRLYFENLDVLVIDEIGKNISGTGFDTNIVGRYHTAYAHGGPNIKRLVSLDLTEQSGGNANGVGILDFICKRLYNKINLAKTYPNCLTTTVPDSVKIPMILDDDKKTIQAAIKTSNCLSFKNLSLVRIKNTLCLSEIEVCESLAGYVESHPHLERISDPYEWSFNKGNLLG